MKISMNLKTKSETAFPQKVNYGLDAPVFQRSALFGGLSAVILGTVVPRYRRTLRSLGWTSLERWFPNFLFVTPTRVLRATKP